MSITEEQDAELRGWLERSVGPFVEKRMKQVNELTMQNKHLRTQLSRAARQVSPDELVEGQTVAAEVDEGWAVFTAKRDSATDTVLADEWGVWSVPEAYDRIILLADAPSPRLTVEELDAEPERRGTVIEPDDLRVGDVVDIYGGSGILLWKSVPASIVGESQALFADAGLTFIPDFWDYYQFRLISRPEVTAEDIRASEKGTTFEDCDGDVWEWRGDEPGGRGLTSHNFGSEFWRKMSDHVDWVIEKCGPLTRSNAPARGDYTVCGECGRGE